MRSTAEYLLLDDVELILGDGGWLRLEEHLCFLDFTGVQEFLDRLKVNDSLSESLSKEFSFVWQEKRECTDQPPFPLLVQLCLLPKWLEVSDTTDKQRLTSLTSV